MNIIEKTDKYLIVDLIEHDDIYIELNKLMSKYNIKEARYNGIGAVYDAVIGYGANQEYNKDLSKVKHNKKTFKQPLEIISFNGNYKNGRLHTHCALSGPNLEVYAGHFYGGKTRFVVQLYIDIYK